MNDPTDSGEFCKEIIYTGVIRRNLRKGAGSGTRRNGKYYQPTKADQRAVQCMW